MTRKERIAHIRARFAELLGSAEIARIGAERPIPRRGPGSPVTMPESYARILLLVADGAERADDNGQMASTGVNQE